MVDRDREIVGLHRSNRGMKCQLHTCCGEHLNQGTSHENRPGTANVCVGFLPKDYFVQSLKKEYVFQYMGKSLGCMTAQETPSKRPERAPGIVEWHRFVFCGYQQLKP